MISLALMWSVIAPIVSLVVPGIVIPRSDLPPAAYVARLILWSFATWIIVSFIVAFVHLPLLYAALVIGVLTFFVWRRKSLDLSGTKTIWLVVAAAYIFFGIVFLVNHNGLPTGDSQKAIYWGLRSIELQATPDYQQSVTLLNRDPVDFYTPGLHTLTALLLTISGHWATIGWLAIALGVAVAVVAMAITYELTPAQAPAWLAYVAGWLVLTNPRFLRYLREPGYHLQNVVGELLLFGLLLVALSLLKRWRWSDVLLGLMLGLALLLSHQFSAFLAAFMLLPAGLLLLGHYGRTALRPHVTPIRLVGVLLVVLLCLLAGYVLGLHQKIPHLFTLTPHLRHFVLPVSQYPRLLGFLWVYGGLAGLYLMLRRSGRQLSAWGFAGALLCSLALSYGPWWGVDIPPVRALFYSIVPLCVALTVGFAQVATSPKRNLMALTLGAVVLASGTSSVAQALDTSHSVRTNATLTDGQLLLIRNLEQTAAPGGVLVDDYNRRSSSWLLLSGRPMYTRLAADVRTHMDEAKQSALRQQLYLNHLDYEKIFALGSFPEITQLLTKHGLSFVTGIRGSSDTAFSHNPALAAADTVDDITLFTVQPSAQSALPAQIAPWLLKPSTLVNDIGDDEDTFEHLPAALRASRLGQPEIQDGQTVRRTTSPYFTLRFNVRDYVQVLWSKEGRPVPDGPLEFYWQITQAPPDLALILPFGERRTLASHVMIRLERTSVPFDEQGFISLTVANPTQQPVVINLVALGLARTP